MPSPALAAPVHPQYVFHPQGIVLAIINLLITWLFMVFTILGLVFYYHNSNSVHSTKGVFSYSESLQYTENAYAEITDNPVFRCLTVYTTCKASEHDCVRTALPAIPPGYLTDHVPDLLMPVRGATLQNLLMASKPSFLPNVFDACMVTNPVWYVNTEPFQSTLFLGSYNYKAMLLSVLAIMSAFYVFTFPMQWGAPEHEINARDEMQYEEAFFRQNHRLPGTVTWFGTGGVVQSLLAAVWCLGIALAIYFTSMRTNKDVVVQPAATSSALAFLSCALATAFFLYDLMSNSSDETHWRLMGKAPPVIRVPLVMSGVRGRAPQMMSGARGYAMAPYAPLPQRPRLAHSFNRPIDDKITETDHMQFANYAMQFGACLCEPLLWVSVLGNLEFLDNTHLRIVFACILFANAVKFFIHYEISQERDIVEMAKRKSMEMNMTPQDRVSFEKMHKHARMFLFTVFTLMWVIADSVLWWIYTTDTLVYDVPANGPFGYVSPVEGNKAILILLTVNYAVDTLYFAVVYFDWAPHTSYMLARRLWFQVVKPCFTLGIVCVAFNTVPRSQMG